MNRKKKKQIEESMINNPDKWVMPIVVSGAIAGGLFVAWSIACFMKGLNPIHQFENLQVDTHDYLNRRKAQLESATPSLPSTRTTAEYRPYEPGDDFYPYWPYKHPA